MKNELATLTILTDIAIQNQTQLKTKVMLRSEEQIQIRMIKSRDGKVLFT